MAPHHARSLVLSATAPRLLLLLIGCLAARHGARGEIDVRELDDSNWDEIIDGSQHVLVEFYTQDCGHCRTFEPEYYAVAEILEPEDDIILARCDTDNAPKAKRRYGIDGHPVFKWFAKGTTDPDKFYFVHYTGRMGNTLLKMLGERTGVERELAPITTEVVKVSAETFEEKAMDRSKHVMAYLYSPWNEQKPVQEALEKAAKVFAPEGDVLFIKLPIERVFERDIADRFKVKDYPGVIYFDKSNENEYFGGPYDDAGHWVRFLNKKLGTEYEATGKLKVEVGRVKKLDLILNEHQGAATPEMVSALTAAIAELPADQKEFADYYLRTMEKIQDESKGPNYVTDEMSRLEKLLKKPTISSSKKKQFMIRKNILGAFAAAAAKDAKRDEL